jgi:acetyl-CoA carboxylase biotin carboxyl carrier protein
MDIRKIKKLIDLVEDSGIVEIEISDGEESVRISRYSSSPANFSGAVGYIQAPVSAAPVAQQLEVKEEKISSHVIKSPMVGTFYRSASPGSAAFVEIGQSVSIGETVCIIEAMKILNQIESDKDGKIKKILVENGQPVEYGQSLFILE